MSKINPKLKSEQRNPRNPQVFVLDEDFKIYDLHANLQSKMFKKENRPELYFSRMVDLFMFAMIHGYNNNLRMPLDGKKVRLFDWSNLKEEVDEAIIKSIALLDSKKQGKDEAIILLSKNEMIQIAEEYANGGLHDFIKAVGGTDYETDIITLLSTMLDEAPKENKDSNIKKKE